MSWARKRIEAYRRGEKPTWLEVRSLEQSHPVPFMLQLLALVLLVVGLWNHDINYIIMGLVFGTLGHVHASLQDDRQE